MSVDAHQPIVTTEGFLVKPGQEELDEEVRLGTIVYINTTIPKFAKFKDFDKQVAQRNSSVHTKVHLADAAANQKTPLPAAPPSSTQSPDFSVSAGHAPIETSELEQQRPKPHKDSQIVPGETIDSWIAREEEAGRMVRNGGQYIYEGQKLNGKKALVHYLENRQVG